MGPDNEGVWTRPELTDSSDVSLGTDLRDLLPPSNEMPLSAYCPRLPRPSRLCLNPASARACFGGASLHHSFLVPQSLLGDSPLHPRLGLVGFPHNLKSWWLGPHHNHGSLSPVGSRIEQELSKEPQLDN